MQKQTFGRICLSMLALLSFSAITQAQNVPVQPQPRQTRPRVQAMSRNQTALIPMGVMKGYLKLSEEQVTKIKPLQEKAHSTLLDLRTQIQGEKDRAKIMESLTKYRASMEQSDKDVEAILTDEQKKKIPDMKKEMQLFNSVGLPPESISDLKLNEEQKKKLTAISEEVQTKRATIPPAERREKAQELSKEARDKAMEVLTAEQKTIVEKQRKLIQEERKKQQETKSPAPKKS